MKNWKSLSGMVTFLHGWYTSHSVPFFLELSLLFRLSFNLIRILKACPSLQRLFFQARFLNPPFFILKIWGFGNFRLLFACFNPWAKLLGLFVSLFLLLQDLFRWWLHCAQRHRAQISGGIPRRKRGTPWLEETSPGLELVFLWFFYGCWWFLYGFCMFLYGFWWFLYGFCPARKWPPFLGWNCSGPTFWPIIWVKKSYKLVTQNRVPNRKTRIKSLKSKSSTCPSPNFKQWSNCKCVWLIILFHIIFHQNMSSFSFWLRCSKASKFCVAATIKTCESWRKSLGALRSVRQSWRTQSRMKLRLAGKFPVLWVVLVLQIRWSRDFRILSDQDGFWKFPKKNVGTLQKPSDDHVLSWGHLRMSYNSILIHWKWRVRSQNVGEGTWTQDNPSIGFTIQMICWDSESTPLPGRLTWNDTGLLGIFQLPPT